MKSNAFLYLIILVLFFALYLATQRKITSLDPQNNARSHLLSHQNDSLRAENVKLDSSLASLYRSIGALQSKINQSQQYIFQIKQREHDKDILIDRFTNLELYRFFANFSAVDSSP